MKLYLLPNNTEFVIDEADDVLKVKQGDEEPFTIVNRFLFRKMDGMYGICLDEHNNIHYLHAGTEVIPSRHN